MCVQCIYVCLYRVCVSTGPGPPTRSVEARRWHRATNTPPCYFIFIRLSRCEREQASMHIREYIYKHTGVCRGL